MRHSRSIRTRLRGGWAAICAVTLMFTMGLVAAGPAQAADDPETAMVSGVVQGPGSETPGNDVSVSLYAIEDGFWQQFDQMWAATDGSYEFDELPAGTYTMSFEIASNVWTAYDQYLGGGVAQPHVTGDPGAVFHLGVGEAKANFDVVLKAGVSVSGQVTGVGIPFGTLSATLYYLQPPARGMPQLPEQTRSASVKPDGSFEFVGVHTGAQVIVSVGGPGVPETLSGNVWFLHQAIPDTVGTGTLSLITLKREASVTGVVTGSDGTPLADVDLRICPLDAFTETWTFVVVPPVRCEEATTDANGRYTGSGLHGGNHAIEVNPYNGNSGTAYYHHIGGAVSFPSGGWSRPNLPVEGAPIVLVPGQTLTRDITFKPLATVSGTVVAPGIDPSTLSAVLYGVTERSVGIIVHETLTEAIDIAVLDAQGRYSFKDLTPGAKYTVSIVDWNETQVFLGDTPHIDAARTFLASNGAVIPSIRVGAPEPVPANLDALVATSSVTVSGVARVGEKLSAGSGTWLGAGRAPAGLSHQYQWFRGTQPIAGAIGNLYTLVAADYGHPIRVKVTAHAPGFKAASLTSGSTASVTKAVSTVALTTSKSKQAYGTKKPVTLTATVKAAGGSTAGKVQFKDGKKVVKTVVVKNGQATYKVSKKLKVGKHSWSAVFVPSTASVAGSASSVKKVTVAKAAAKVTAKLSKSKIKSKSKAKVSIKVTANGKAASGKVTVKWGKKSKTYSVKKGKVTVTLPKLKKGKYSIKVSFKGTKTVKAKSAKTLRLTVK